MASERTPLLDGPNQSSTNLIDSDSFGGERIYICKVCSKRGVIPSNFNGRVVKCVNCGEGTPICLPPAGKKYVRCVCHCLLVCSTTANFLRCPRRTCTRIVEVYPDQKNQQSPAPIRINAINADADDFSPSGEPTPPKQRASRPVHQQSTYICPHCKHLFDWPAGQASAKCTFCTDWCVLDSRWPRRRSVFCYFFAVFCFLATATVAATTYTMLEKHEEIIAAWVVGAIATFICFFSGLRYMYLSRYVVMPLPAV